MTESLGDRIRARRQRRGWTLKELGEKTKISVPYLSDIERRNEANPTLESLESIATALECTVTDLLGANPADSSRPLPLSLQRFVRGDDFARRLERLAGRAGRDPAEMKEEVINFLVSAPKRSSGELAADDWRRLLDFYSVILDQ